MRQTLIVTSTNDARGSCLRELHLEDDGSLVIEGHEVGRGVANSWGDGLTEDEFSPALVPVAVDQMRALAALGDGALPDALKACFGNTAGREEFLRTPDIKNRFWSSIGD